MIIIADDDLPITVADRIITGVKPVSAVQRTLNKAFTGEDCDGQDMFDLEDIKEIADYLLVYYNNHSQGD